MSNMDRIANKLVETMKEATQPKTKGYDTEATVRRIEDGIAWVHIPGGVDETPVKMTINANPGDHVQIRVENGRAHMTGNASAPPTDDKTANIARTIAATANEKAKEAESTAANASQAAQSAKKIADNTNQYFWTTQEGEDTGAHITEIPQDEFLENPSGGNTLIRSNGMAIRNGLTELAQFAQDRVQIGHDGVGKTIVTRSGIEFVSAEGVTIGKITSTGSDITAQKSTNTIYRQKSISTTSSTRKAEYASFSVVDPLTSTRYPIESWYEYAITGTALIEYQDRVEEYNITKDAGGYISITAATQIIQASGQDSETDNADLFVKINDSYVKIGSFQIVSEARYYSERDNLSLSSIYTVTTDDSQLTGVISITINLIIDFVWYSFYYISTAKAPEYLFGTKSTENEAGEYAFQAGNEVYAEGDGQVAIGDHVRTKKRPSGTSTMFPATSIAMGYYNALMDVGEDILLALGNGTSASNRSNAFQVDWKGGTYNQLDPTAAAGTTDGDLYGAIEDLAWEYDVFDETTNLVINKILLTKILQELITLNTFMSNVGGVGEVDYRSTSIPNNTAKTVASFNLVEGGVYIITAGVNFSTNATGNRAIAIGSGTAVNTESGIYLPAQNPQRLSTTRLFYPDQDMTVNVNLFQNSGAALTTSSSGVNMARCVRLK